METTPKPRGGKKIAPTDFPVSSTYAEGMDAIANGINSSTTTFEASSDIGTLTLSPRRSPSIVVHDTKNLIPDEHTMAAVIADAKKLGIFPFGKTEKTEADKPDDTPTE